MRGQRWPVVMGDTLAALAIVAWVGGHAALGAFAARIAFRELPRVYAAQTMTAVFRSFDGLIAAAMVVLLGGAILRAVGAGLSRRAERIIFFGAVALCTLGLFEVLWVHPQIEQMFDAGRTLEPQFQSLHKLSARCANLEIVLAALVLGAQAWSRRA